jgi:putative hydrolase of the HAD superfamily
VLGAAREAACRLVVSGIEVVAFDGDDTLWHNETIFTMTQERYAALLEPYVDADVVHDRMLETERRNVALFGYGIKGFTLSMIETAIEITGGRVTADELRTILDFGKAMLQHPTELLDGARDAIEAAASFGRVLLITKGDLFDQESKLARSGLGDLFDAVEIVSEKDEARYARLLAAHGVAPDRFLMVGNSMRSDIVPVVRIGGLAVHVPYHVTWALEEIDPADTPDEGWWRIDHLSGLPGILGSVGGSTG